MSFLPGIGPSRREFFREAARYVLLSGLAAVAVLTGTRRGRAGQRCINSGLCNGCGVFASCGLPQALSAKLAGRGGVYGTRAEKS